jgi:hypothetical protein
VTVLKSEEGFAGREQSCRNWKSPRATNKRRLACTWTCRAGGKAEEHKNTAEGDDWASIRSGRCRSHHNEITLHYFPLPPFYSLHKGLSPCELATPFHTIRARNWFTTYCSIPLPGSPDSLGTHTRKGIVHSHQALTPDAGCRSFRVHIMH